MKKNSILITFTALSMLSLSLASGSVQASQCKGLEVSSCSSNTACSWIEGYTRKDGRQVKSFCRSKPGSKAKAALTKNGSQALAGRASKSGVKSVIK